MFDSLAFAVRVIAGAVVLLLPGLAWSYALLPRGEAIGWFYRGVVGVGLSFVLVPMTVFWLFVSIRLPVTEWSVVVVSALVTLAALLYLRLWPSRTSAEQRGEDNSEKDGESRPAE